MKNIQAIFLKVMITQILGNGNHMGTNTLTVDGRLSQAMSVRCIMKTNGLGMRLSYRSFQF